jgi:hypothetical protein
MSFFEARSLSDFDRGRLTIILNEKTAGQKLRAEIDKAMGKGSK